MTTIGVVIPVRNNGPLLAETLESVAAQTRPASAVVVVDDGSDDGTLEAVRDDFPGVTWIRQEHRGTAAARNRGAGATDCEALLFLDADDLLRPGALAALGAALDADSDLEMVHGRVREFVDERTPPPPGMRHAESEVTARIAGSTLIRRSLWERVGGMDEDRPRGEWIDWMSRALQAAPSATEVGEVVLDRRLHAANKSATATDRAPYLTSVVRAALLRKRGVAPT